MRQESSKDLDAGIFMKAFLDKVEGVRKSTAATEPLLLKIRDVSQGFNEFQKINSFDISKLISAAANKQCELDPAPTWLVKKFSNELSPSIAIPFNSSMSTGTFPVVTPILQKSTLDSNDTVNYRLVSNLTFLSKLLERAAHHQLKEYINLNNLLPVFKSAYRSFRSTGMAVLRVLCDAYSAADRGLVTLLGFIDLSAAFDTVDHHILIKWMPHTFGISDCVFCGGSHCTWIIEPNSCVLGVQSRQPQW